MKCNVAVGERPSDLFEAEFAHRPFIGETIDPDAIEGINFLAKITHIAHGADGLLTVFVEED